MVPTVGECSGGVAGDGGPVFELVGQGFVQQAVDGGGDHEVARGTLLMFGDVHSVVCVGSVAVRLWRAGAMESGRRAGAAKESVEDTRYNCQM